MSVKYKPEIHYRPCLACAGTGSRPGALVRLMNSPRRSTADALNPDSGEEFRCGVCKGTGKVVNYGATGAGPETPQDLTP